MSTTIAGHQYDITAADVRRSAQDLDPEPIETWLAVVDGRRFPPKQLVEAVTGLDRADFNSHQARSLLKRLGFPVERRRPVRPAPASRAGPHGGAERRLLEDYVGRWVAQDGIEILHDADTPQQVAAWLHRHSRTARVWRVPGSPGEVGSTVSAP